MFKFFDKRKFRKFLRIKQEDVILIALGFMSFSCGVWANYRQLWLQSEGFSVTQISSILSAALICSAVISFVLSLFSTKIRVKSVMLLALIFRCLAMMCLLLVDQIYVIKVCVLLTIMCEVIFSIAYYPLLTYVGKSDELYRKKSLIDYLSKDAAIVSCGLLIGVTVGRVVFDYNSCLFISMISCIVSLCFFLLYHKEKPKNKENNSLIKNSVKILKNKVNIWFLISQLVVNISYGIIYGLMMLMLTKYIGFEVSFASVFIIICNLIGSFVCSLFNKFGKKIPVWISILIKFGLRSGVFFLAFACNNTFVFIIGVITYFITSRILEDKVTGTYLNRISKDNQFLFGNIRYFICCTGEGIGVYLAGLFIVKSLGTLFLGAAISTMIQVLIMLNLERIRNRK